VNGALNLHPKVAGGTLAGSLTLIVVWVLSLVHVIVPLEIGMAFTLLFTFVGGWLAPASAAPAA
jgi:hypothetical protein